MNTNSTALILTSSVPASVTNDIRSIKAPVEIPSAWTWLWWTLGALAVGVACWLAWRRWKKKAALAPPEVVVPAHDRAREKLRAALALIGQPLPFCTSVSDAVRVYIEERFSFHAPDRTTEEFLDELQSSALLTFDQKQTLGEFLARCDLVKFARYEPREAELRELYDAAVRLVDETQPSPPLPEGGSDPAHQSSITA